MPMARNEQRKGYARKAQWPFPIYADVAVTHVATANEQQKINKKSSQVKSVPSSKYKKATKKNYNVTSIPPIN